MDDEQDSTTRWSPDRVRRLGCRVALLLGACVLAAAFVVPAVFRPGDTVSGRAATVYEVVAQAESGQLAEVLVASDQRTIVAVGVDGTYYHAPLDRFAVDEQLSRFVDAGIVPRVGDADDPFTVPVVGVTGRSDVAVHVPLAGLGAVLLLVGAAGEVVHRRAAKRAARSAGAVAVRPTTRFVDVAGCSEAVDEARDIVEMLARREEYTRLGATVPKGVLLSGPPGVGKTLLARAIAGELDAGFFSASGSQFVEMYVGVGPSRVRELFASARSAGRAVVFIDEIDAIGKTRSAGGPGTSGGTHEYESTLNQLLVEMDGFDATHEIVVVAATNRPEVLDPALVRPGRFDRKVHIALPDRSGRAAILAKHLERSVLDEDVDVADLAGRCAGMSGADLAAVVNEAAIAAAKAQRHAVRTADLAAAIRDQQAGRELRSRQLTVDERTVVAWHEAGHALCAAVTAGARRPDYVSIVPRGNAGGVTWVRPREGLVTRSGARSELVVLLAGRAAEERLLDGDYTSGAASDLQQATALARRMVLKLGMGTRLAVRDAQPVAYRHGGEDPEVEQLLLEAMESARGALESHREALETLVATLLEREHVDGTDIDRIIAAHPRATATPALMPAGVADGDVHRRGG